MQCLDKKGNAFWVQTGREAEIAQMVEMYTGFRPKGAYQGLPPANAPACGVWIRHLFAGGINLVAGREDQIIGHAALLPDLKLGDAEYLVFVHQHHRGQGIGTALTRTALDHARDLGLSMIWLSVDGCNFIAIRLYRKFGFYFTDAGHLDAERKMVLPLSGGRTGKC
jgi:ribosomal protein S18 acetylase RimI-like enzyme